MIIQPKKVRNVTSNLGDVSNDQTNGLRASALFTVDIEGKVEKVSTGIFLLNPDSIKESKSSNWIPQQTPGQSDPALQWMSSGPRTLSFTALVTADTSDLVVVNSKPGTPAKNSGFLSKIFNGKIASAFAKTKVEPQPRVAAVGDITIGGKLLDISNYLNYYRSLLYPIYDNIDNPRRLVGSPPLVVFYSGSSINKIPIGDRISDQTDVWVVTNLEINITKQLPNLAPMEADVSFQLTQYTIKSFDRRRFLK